MENTTTGGLSCDLIVPLGWFQRSASSEGDCSSRHKENFNRLQIVLGMDDHYSRDIHEEESGLTAEIQRLDFKINVVLGLVAQLVTARSEFPRSVSLSLGAGMLNFEIERNVLSSGMALTFELFLDVRYPMPVIFNGRIESVESKTDQISTIKVVLEVFPDEFKELLEKYIFRCHRRHVARLKKSNI